MSFTALNPRFEDAITESRNIDKVSHVPPLKKGGKTVNPDLSGFVIMPDGMSQKAEQAATPTGEKQMGRNTKIGLGVAAAAAVYWFFH